MWIHLLTLGQIDGAGGSAGVSGSAATTNADDTASASGSTTVVGSLARANANDAGSATGSTTVVGSSARTNANDTSSASGAAGSITGASATTNANDAATASGRTPSGSDVPGIDVGYGSTSTRTPKWWAKSGQEDEPEAVEAPKPKREPKKAAKAQEQAKAVIEAVARDQAARGDVPKSARFAEVRSQIKPLGSEATGFNWPALYERLYAQALTDAIRQEMAVADHIRQRQLMQEEETLLLLLAEA
jgi:hypothetical protein